MEGTPFGRYRLIERLGHGGMGEVWRAYDTDIDRVVALKMLLPSFAADQIFEQRFRREARAAARLDDPHVVPIYDVGEIDGRLYVTMRLIKGLDLQTLLDAGPLEPARAVAIVAQVAAALHAAHEVGLIHRDVKPSNILVTEDNFAYLIDFGIARVAGETGLTSTGATVGTWSYMAPERFNVDEIKPSSDIYALACVLYQCLTGQLPYPGTTLERIAMAHMATPPPKPSQARATIPSAMDEVIATGLAKQPAQRYQTTNDLAAAARAAINVDVQRPDSPPPEPTGVAPTPPHPHGLAMLTDPRSHQELAAWQPTPGREISKTLSIWALVELALACAALVVVGLSWLHSRHTVSIAPIADGQPVTTSLVYDPQLLLLTMLFAIFAGVLAVNGVARLRRSRREGR